MKRESFLSMNFLEYTKDTEIFRVLSTMAGLAREKRRQHKKLIKQWRKELNVFSAHSYSTCSWAWWNPELCFGFTPPVSAHICCEVERIQVRLEDKYLHMSRKKSCFCFCLFVSDQVNRGKKSLSKCYRYHALAAVWDWVKRTKSTGSWA